MSNGKIQRIPDLVYNQIKKSIDIPELEEGFYKIDKIQPYKQPNKEYSYYMY
jgi:hypothetical protein